MASRAMLDSAATYLHQAENRSHHALAAAARQSVETYNFAGADLEADAMAITTGTQIADFDD